MKYCIIVTSDTGKTIKIAGNELLNIHVTDQNRVIARITVSNGKAWDGAGNEIQIR